MSEKLHTGPVPEQIDPTAVTAPANTLPHRGAPAPDQTPATAAAEAQLAQARQGSEQYVQAEKDVKDTAAAEEFDGIGAEGHQTPAMATAKNRLEQVEREDESIVRAKQAVEDTAAAEKFDGIRE